MVNITLSTWNFEIYNKTVYVYTNVAEKEGTRGTVIEGYPITVHPIWLFSFLNILD